MADTVYYNGLYNGTTDAWEINFGFSVTDSFTCGNIFGCEVQGLNIVTWNFPGDSLNSLEMQLGSTSFGNDYSDQVVSPSGSADLGTNEFGFELWRYDFTFLGADVPYGSSWITVSNAVTSQGQPIYWDENGGIGCPPWEQGCPSSAYENSVGSIPSESFTLTGILCGPGGPDYCGPPAPEPSSILLFGSGILGLAGILRRKLNI
jgi:hypothetical protein